MAVCMTCGNDHGDQKCFLIKAYEYYPDGKLKRIEYLTPADLKPTPAQDNVIPFGKQH